MRDYVPLTQTSLDNDVSIEVEAASIKALEDALRHLEAFRHYAGRLAGLLTLDIETGADDGDWAYEIRRVAADWLRRQQGRPEPEAELISFSAYDPLEAYLHPDHVREVWLLHAEIDAVVTLLYVDKPDDVDIDDVVEFGWSVVQRARESERIDRDDFREAVARLDAKLREYTR